MDLDLRWKYWHLVMDMYSIEYIAWEKRQWEAIVCGYTLTAHRREDKSNGEHSA